MSARRSSVARVWAESLLAVAEEKGVFASVHEALAEVAGLFQDATIRGFFETSAVGTREKRRAIEAAFSMERGAPEIFTNFLRLLADRGRLRILPAIAEEWRRVQDDRAGRVRVPIQSAVPLDPPTIERMRDVLARSLKKEIEVEPRVEPSLLGGMVLSVGDLQIDGSIRTRLKRVRARLMEKKPT
ncbi:MAG: ATP synthase F1 subunit delta [Planctomycetes bacterium]|nr:ATP synthase F1 subunit delta [Planctomycetota bacterium]